MIKSAFIRTHGGDWLGIAALIAMLAWFCDEMIFDGKVPFFRDLGTYTFPIKFSLAKSLQAGELPLWERHMAAGFPLLAAFQQGAFYPPSLVFYALPFFDAIRFTFFFHYMIAASGVYFLCRWWKQPVYISIIVATLFTIGGTTVSLSNLLNHFQTAVWLPWLIFGWERTLLSRTWTSFLLLSLLSLCALLAGSPEIYLLCLALMFLDGIRLSRCEQSVTLAGVFTVMATSNFLVAALGMVQFLPTLELLSQSRREQPIPFQEATAWSLNPLSLVGLFFPDKEVDAGIPIGVRLFFGRDIPFLLTHYLGILSLVAICCWFYWTSTKERVVTMATIAVSLILACGSNTPLYQYLFDATPVLQAIRFPEKFFFFTNACLVFIVYRGLVAFHKTNESHPTPPLLIVLSILTIWVGSYALLRLAPELLQRLAAHQVGDASGPSATAVTHATILFHLERQIAITVVLLLLLFCRVKKILNATLFQVFLVAVVICDLAAVHKPFQFLLDPSLASKATLMPPSAHADGSRLFYYPPGGNLHPSFVSVLGRPSFVKATSINVENLLPNTGIMYGYDYFQEIDALTRQPYNDFLNFANLASVDMRIKLLRALNVRFVVSFRELKASGLTLNRHLPEQYSWLYEVKDPVPRVYLASQALQETQPAKIIRILSSKEFNPKNQVIVAEPLTSKMPTEVKGSAQITHYGNSSVVINASTLGPALLVLADSYYPGWKVFVDGQEQKIVRANHFFRAVELTPGDHKVTFEYAPWSFTLGLWISCITLSIVVLVTVAQSVRAVGAQRNSYALVRI